MSEETEKVEAPVTEPLQDVVEMIEARPELSQAEWEIVDKAIPWLKASLKPEIRAELEVEYSKKFDAQMEVIREQNREYVDAQFAAVRKAQEPLAEDDIKKLLSQEYVEFDVLLRLPSKEDKSKKENRTFIICEQPSAVEERFLKVLKKALIPLLQDRDNLSFRLEKASLVEKIQIIIEASEEALNAGAELVAVCLDPWEEDKTINKNLVRKYISI